MLPTPCPSPSSRGFRRNSQPIYSPEPFLDAAHFPEPFPFHSRIFSRISKYLNSMRTKSKGCCTCLYQQFSFLDDDDFTDLVGIKPEVFTKEKFQFWLIGFSASIKPWQLSQNVQNLLLNVLEIPLEYWECSLRYYSWRNCILLEDTLKSLCWKIDC